MSVYRKSIFERDGKFKFLHLLEGDRPAPLVESVESSSPFDMSLTPIQVTFLRPGQRTTEHDYFDERIRLEGQGWKFLIEAFDEIPIAI
jgi:hypothetical protein